jgi:hypothetical protein
MARAATIDSVPAPGSETCGDQNSIASNNSDLTRARAHPHARTHAARQHTGPGGSGGGCSIFVAAHIDRFCVVVARPRPFAQLELLVAPLLRLVGGRQHLLRKHGAKSAPVT